jgi:hypothetical protein
MAEAAEAPPAHTPFGELSKGAKDELIIGLAALVCHDSEKETSVIIRRIHEDCHS